MEFRGGRWLMWLVFAILVILIIQFGTRQLRPSEKTIESWNDFMKSLKEGEIELVAKEGDRITGTYKPGQDYERFVLVFEGELDRETREEIAKYAEFRFEPPSRWLQILGWFMPWVLILAFIWFFFLRQLRASGGPGGVLSFGKSRATLVTKEKTRKTFADVAGVEEAKEEVLEIITFLKTPKKFLRMGARIPKGVLLIGAPGTGKTLLAKAIAGEAGVPFYSISGSDFVEMFVGVGASRVRDLFQQAKENSPCIIFLDEIDAVGRRRGTGLGGGHDEREQTLNAILVEMDGFESDENVIVMAATNRPDVLDPALLRPGRFDRRIIIDLPDVRGRAAILRVHGRHVRLDDDIDFDKMAKATPSFSGADLENTINEAALLAVMRAKSRVTMAEIEEARDKVIWGKEKRRVIDEDDRRIMAHHEAGHALLAHILPEVDKLHKVTIIPRGMALGATMHLPKKDEYNKGRKKLMGELTVLYGGRVSEEMFCSDISTGASHDIQQATDLARRMVCDWGMSELGPVNYAAEEEHLFLGHEIARQRQHSEATSIEIDREVKRIVDEALGRTRKLLDEHRGNVGRIAKALLEYEVLSAEDVDLAMKGEPLGREPSGAAPESEAKAKRA
ncbi:MAG: ATP-dependent zinc metalloprotease FtsH [Planctomycetota bacterium]|jgi:cell division protease FtsH